MSYVVTGPLVILKNEDGQLVHLYEGATVPESVADGEIDRLVNLELIEKEGSSKASKSQAKGDPTDEAGK